MANQYREFEETFNRLKQKFSQKKISQREFIDSLKELRVKDHEGRFWMIGAQTGKWYYFDGTDWIQAQPPSFEERKLICISCGFENDLEAETCVRCGRQHTSAEPAAKCFRCGKILEHPGAPCPSCESRPSKPRPRFRSSLGGFLVPDSGPGFLIRSVHAGSFLWFFGALGLFSGMLLGLIVGVTSLFPGFIDILPNFFRDIQGTLLGGIVFTILGGILGFAGGAGGGYLAASAFNGILSLTGGLKVGADKIGKED